MARYIDADELAEYITTNYCKNCDIYDGEKCNACPMNDALNYIETFQTADVVPKSEVENAEAEIERLKHILDCYALQYGTVTEQQKVIDEAIDNAKTELDLLKSTITHKEEQAYAKGYADAKADILEKLQADIARDEIFSQYGDEFFEGRIAGFEAVINYLNAEGE